MKKFRYSGFACIRPLVVLVLSLSLYACPLSQQQSLRQTPVVSAEEQAKIDLLQSQLETLELKVSETAAAINDDLIDWSTFSMLEIKDDLDYWLAQCQQTPYCHSSDADTLKMSIIATQQLALSTQWTLINSADMEPEEDQDLALGTGAFPSFQPGQAAVTGAGLFRPRDIEHGLVQAALDDWLTWMRPKLMSAWEYYQFLRPEIAPVYAEAGLPEALLFAMVATESGGKVHAHSRAGASGLLQFVRSTGRRYGLNSKGDFDQRMDPVAATRANVKYIKDYLPLLDNSLPKVLAAYNGGENRMIRLHRRHKKAPLWESKLFYSLPKETRQYVPRVLAAAWLFSNAEHYNLSFTPIGVAIENLILDQSISISELTVCLGQEGNNDGWFRTIRNLNPEIKPETRLESGRSIRLPAALKMLYESKCHEPELMQIAQRIHAANYPEGPQWVPYKIRAGDTLDRIARRFNCTSITEIAAINRIRAPRYLIRAGKRLMIPKC